VAWFGAGLAFFGVQIAWLTKLFLATPASVPPGGLVTAGAVNNFPLGSVTPFRKEHFVLTHDVSGFLALSTVCTHQKCPVNYLPAQQIIFCACHNSRFSPTGAVLSGPASRPLARFVTMVQNGQVVVDTSRLLHVS
jgi:Rieske Fe-S protein